MIERASDSFRASQRDAERLNAFETLAVCAHSVFHELEVWRLRRLHGGLSDNWWIRSLRVPRRAQSLRRNSARRWNQVQWLGRPAPDALIKQECCPQRLPRLPLRSRASPGVLCRTRTRIGWSGWRDSSGAVTGRRAEEPHAPPDPSARMFRNHRPDAPESVPGSPGFSARVISESVPGSLRNRCPDQTGIRNER